jgi:hypothetical protein
MRVAGRLFSRTVSRLVDGILRYFYPGCDEHLSDEQLAAFFGRKLSVAARWMTRRHLTKCLYCRARRERLEGACTERVLQVYREGMESADPVLPGQPRLVFAHWLDTQLDTQMQHKSVSARRVSRLPKLALPRFSTARPALSAGVLLCLGTCLVGLASFFGYRWWQSVPNLSEDALLARAESWDAVSSTADAGVILQTVQIKTAKQTIARSLYRDLQGKRHPHNAALDRPREQLKVALDKAGIDWDQPISASDYQVWHDSQPGRSDRVVRSSAHLFTLITTVPEGPVSRESLTVRDSDFHPLRRTVAFRGGRLGYGGETVEVAELDYAVLPWSAVDANAFEPLADLLPTSPARSLPALPRPQVSDADALDETELAARLILDRLHADTGEQIDIHRSAQQVAVDGLVDTEERRRALTAELAMVPRLKVSIQSIAHLTDYPSPGGETIRVEEASLPDQASALDTYLRARGRSVEESSVLARRLFDCALTISQESSAIADLNTRFADRDRLSLVALATLASLRYSHHERLEAAVREQRALLAQVQGRIAVRQVPRPTVDRSLVDAAARNLALAKELTRTDNPPTRSAEAILDDIFVAVDGIAAAAYQQSGTPAEDRAHNSER